MMAALRRRRISKAWKGMPRSVYVAEREDGLVKIGIAKDPRDRLERLSARLRMKISLERSYYRPDGDALLIESIAHERLADHETEREWFNVLWEKASDVVEAAISSVETGQRSLQTGERPKPMVGSKLIGVNVTEEFHEAVTKAAAAEGRTLSSFVERAVEAALRAAKRKRPS